PVFMHIPCIAINTAMLTTRVGIHAVCHIEIRALDLVHDRPCFLLYVLCWIVFISPVIYSFRMLSYSFSFEKSVFSIKLRTTTPEVIGGSCILGHFRFKGLKG